MKIGYINEGLVSCQSLDSAHSRLFSEGCEKVFYDFRNASSQSPMWHALLSSLASNDTLYIMCSEDCEIQVDSFRRCCQAFSVAVEIVRDGRQGASESGKRSHALAEAIASEKRSPAVFERNHAYLRAANLALWGMPIKEIAKKLGLERHQIYRLTAQLGIKGTMVPL